MDCIFLRYTAQKWQTEPAYLMLPSKSSSMPVSLKIWSTSPSGSLSPVVATRTRIKQGGAKIIISKLGTLSRSLLQTQTVTIWVSQYTLYIRRSSSSLQSGSSVLYWLDPKKLHNEMCSQYLSKQINKLCQSNTKLYRFTQKLCPVCRCWTTHSSRRRHSLTARSMP